MKARSTSSPIPDSASLMISAAAGEIVAGVADTAATGSTEAGVKASTGVPEQNQPRPGYLRSRHGFTRDLFHPDPAIGREALHPRNGEWSARQNQNHFPTPEKCRFHDCLLSIPARFGAACQPATFFRSLPTPVAFCWHN